MAGKKTKHAREPSSTCSCGLVHTTIEVAPGRARVLPDLAQRDEKTRIIYRLKEVAKRPFARVPRNRCLLLLRRRLESKGDSEGRFGLFFEELLPTDQLLCEGPDDVLRLGKRSIGLEQGGGEAGSLRVDHTWPKPAASRRCDARTRPRRDVKKSLQQRPRAQRETLSLKTKARHTGGMAADQLLDPLVLLLQKRIPMRHSPSSSRAVDLQIRKKSLASEHLESQSRAASPRTARPLPTERGRHGVARSRREARPTNRERSAEQDAIPRSAMEMSDRTDPPGQVASPSTSSGEGTGRPSDGREKKDRFSPGHRRSRTVLSQTDGRSRARLCFRRAMKGVAGGSVLSARRARARRPSFAPEEETSLSGHRESRFRGQQSQVSVQHRALSHWRGKNHEDLLWICSG